MGIVKRQGIKTSILVYIGFALGAFNILVLFPNFFTVEELGLTRVLTGTSVTFAQLCLLGIPAVMLKFYPYYKDYLPKKNDFLILSIGLSTFGFIIISLLSLLFYKEITNYFAIKSPLLTEYFYLTYLAGFLLVAYTNLETFSRNNLQNVLPVFLKEVGLRVYTVIITVLYIFKVYDFNIFIILFSSYNFVASIAMLYYLKKLKVMAFDYKISHVTKRLKGKMLKYGGLIYGGGLFSIVADNIDTFLIAGIAGLKSTGIFTVASYIATVLQVPQRTISSVATPILARSWKDKDYANIQYLYEKTSLNQLIFGLAIFLIVWLNIDDLFSFLPESYSEGKYVVLIMCFARILDLGTGINGEMLTTSNKWLFSFYTQIFFISLSIPTNYFLISKYGIIGSAYSNLISYSAFNTIRFVYIYRTFKMQPFSMNTLYIFLISIATYFIVTNIPLTGYRLADVTMRSILVVLCVGIPVLKFKISEDIYILWHQILNKIKALTK